MLAKKKKKNGKHPEFEVFVHLYTTLADTLPRSMHEFLGVNLLCTFRGGVV